MVFEDDFEKKSDHQYVFRRCFASLDFLCTSSNTASSAVPVSKGAGTEPRTFATLALAVRRYKRSARSRHRGIRCF
jgi:hypothetical protein